MCRVIRVPVAAALFAVLACAACTIGPSAARMGFALSPRGATVEVIMRETTIRGELVAVGVNGLIVLESSSQFPAGRLVELRYAGTRRVAESAFGESYRTDGVAPSGPPQAHLRLVSRFPQGIDEAMLLRLLAATGQQKLDTRP